MGVHSRAEAEQMYPDATFLGGRWVTHNKSDAGSHKIRCRDVATEVNHWNDATFYASTPPLEAIRLLAAQMAMKKKRNCKPLAMSFSDATKAYFNASTNRDIFVRPPTE